MFFLELCVAGMLIEDAHDAFDVEILFGVGGEGLVVEVVVLLVLLRELGLGSVGSGRRVGGLGSRTLTFLLVPDLVIDIRIKPGNFFIVNQYGDFALPISQFIPLLPHLFPRPQSHRQSLILYQHISALSR